MNFRSRTCIVVTSLIICVVVLTGISYVLFKHGSEKNPAEKIESTENEQNVTKTVEEEHAKTEQDVEEDNSDIAKTPITIENYNPLTKDYKRKTNWSQFSSHDSEFSAAGADFHNDGDCRRVVVFLVYGVLLGHILTDCDSLEPSMGMVMVDDTLHYYGSAMMNPGPIDDTFMIYEKVPGSEECVMTKYTLTGGERPSLKDKKEGEVVDQSDDYDCKSLINFKLPTMFLLSGNGATGTFAPGRFWATINPWEPLGVVTRIFAYGSRCFRLLVITSYGRSLTAVKVSCGPVENMVVTQDALYFGDAFLIRRIQSDTFSVVLNPKRSGKCIKKTIYFTTQDGRPTAIVKSKENLSPDNKECTSTVNGEISGATIGKDAIEELIERLTLNNLGVEPHGYSMSNYEPWSHLSYINLSMDLGVAVRFYKIKGGGVAVHKLVLAIAKGVPLTAQLLPFSPVHRLVMRENVLYYNTTLMMRKAKEENTFTTLVKIDDEKCLKQSFVLKEKRGRFVKEEQPSGLEVTKNADDDCMDLIEGSQLKNKDYLKLKYATDEDGVPKYLPKEVTFPQNT
ncbi:uncharacterized protein LOC128986264 [Macrosteles quadrilineatus]|uniref:uncharacterized protein LOC128986264 n=1 Tax=Macrosteles quadrilineatus TaxID=74068 RepID=UPI0023E0FCA9|nr:uncharacterized protein LOC128986264 [Macrosteles quadrilineatus]